MDQPYVAKTIKTSDLWKPFQVGPKPDRMRAIHTLEGIGDRLRAVAFAEIQARDGFRLGIERFPEVDREIRKNWLEFAEMEELHAQLLLNRAHDLGVDLSARVVSDNLWRMFSMANEADFFLYLISTAEARGMEIGLSMIEPMRQFDAESAAVFERIARDEADHVAFAERHLAAMDRDAMRVRAQALRY